MFAAMRDELFRADAEEHCGRGDQPEAARRGLDDVAGRDALREHRRRDDVDGATLIGGAVGRREFLARAGRAGIGALGVVSLGGPRAPIRVDRSDAATSGREIVLETRQITWELAPGKSITAMAYNGRVPGPEIRAREGERVRVVLKNSLGEPTTVHWHGVEVPNAMDGVPGITQKPVPTGGSFVYEFEARPAGTRWYHTHFQGHRQLDLGLAAPLIIEPAGGEPFPFDREYTFVLDDWAVGVGPTLPSTSAGVAGGRGEMGGMMSGMRGGGMMGGA